MTKLIPIRHGQSMGNLLLCYSGHHSYPLTPPGYEQAECVADFLCKREPIHRIYSSDLIRAFATAKVTAYRPPCLPQKNFQNRRKDSALI